MNSSERLPVSISVRVLAREIAGFRKPSRGAESVLDDLPVMISVSPRLPRRGPPPPPPPPPPPGRPNPPPATPHRTTRGHGDISFYKASPLLGKDPELFRLPTSGLSWGHGERRSRRHDRPGPIGGKPMK